MPRTNPARYTDPARGTRTKQESARLIGCGDAKVDELIDNGDLQAVRVGNRRLPTVASLERLLGRSIQELEAALREQPSAPADRIESTDIFEDKIENRSPGTTPKRRAGRSPGGTPQGQARPAPR